MELLLLSNKGDESVAEEEAEELEAVFPEDDHRLVVFISRVVDEVRG